MSEENIIKDVDFKQDEGVRHGEVVVPAGIDNTNERLES